VPPFDDNRVEFEPHLHVCAHLEMLTHDANTVGTTFRTNLICSGLGSCSHAGKRCDVLREGRASTMGTRSASFPNRRRVTCT
jgi:argininosuccinate lyase